MGSNGATYPDIQVQIAICDRLDVKSNGGDGRDDFTDLNERQVSTRALKVAHFEILWRWVDLTLSL